MAIMAGDCRHECERGSTSLPSRVTVASPTASADAGMRLDLRLDLHLPLASIHHKSPSPAVRTCYLTPSAQFTANEPIQNPPMPRKPPPPLQKSPYLTYNPHHHYRHHIQAPAQLPREAVLTTTTNPPSPSSGPKRNVAYSADNRRARKA
ncbi:hypothetical protein BAUCODRAFT_261437 [Baudoinia panamericana UAMH 10762]|uniref:Uncharacterized protein n=1 Tax=Baudoinia panamericana (strain UAMH 10762) TaxID=717646 RepID=M2MMU0_BAUPA|nr:uncharacterized protein BAUCODRAFT_261437 [Baudoinia panamericana UAMH 10762]EMC92753.1 hypothetical protein BAUCODRAFT_261437 [Baudoinia panamericana UAMH 10762]